MDLEHVSYILKIAETRSITRAAEECFVTQSALNQQLQKLEKELGTPLFLRNRADWQLTDAGKVYVEMAREILQTKRNAYSRIADMTDEKKTELRLGLIPERGVNMFTAVYPRFHELYPDAHLEPIEGNVRSLQKAVTEGRIDIALMTLKESQKDFNEYIHMNYEEIVLAVPAGHPLAPGGSISSYNAPVISLSRFHDQPFMRMYTSSTMHEIEDQLFTEAGFTPVTLFQTSSNLSKWRMTAVGVGCALLPLSFAAGHENIRYFALPSHPVWEITLCCRKDAYINRLGTTLIGLCKEYWAEQLNLPSGLLS